MDKCAVLVNSCDSYEDTWLPFFKLFKKEWADCPYPIFLNTETKDFNYDGLDIKTFKLYNDNKKRDSWGGRLIKVLNKIDAEYIIFLLDDFFLTDKVDTAQLDVIINEMDTNRNIGVTYLAPMNPIHTTQDKPINLSTNSNYDGKYQLRAKIQNKRIFLKDLFKPYLKKNLLGMNLVNAQAGIWRKEFLLKTLHKKETAWDWECYGTIRAFKFKEDFISLAPLEKPVFKYDYFKGNGIMNGVWILENVETLFKNNDIHIDFSIRGVKTKDWNYKKNKLIKKIFVTPFKVFTTLLHKTPKDNNIIKN